jgi:predicted DNA-binding transcriptional regulator YafY
MRHPLAHFFFYICTRTNSFLMSKRDAISRYNLIIRKVRIRPSSFDEIENYLDIESQIQSADFRISKRTFQRDLNDIRSIYNIDIRFDMREKVYFLEKDKNQGHDYNERLLEAFDIFNTLNVHDRLSEYIHLEKRNPQGTENIFGLLHAIKNHNQIKFTYHKFTGDESSIRTAEPYALKEFRNRWYVLAHDVCDKQVKSFALDRLSDLDIKKKKFEFPGNFDINDHFRYCFGIISPNSEKPEEIVLSFEPHQGKYMKTLPLHETQTILVDNDKEFRVKLTLFITHDFIMELLSLGDTVKVVKPRRLVTQVKRVYERALNLY